MSVNLIAKTEIPKPKMMTIPELVRMKILPEKVIRRLVKNGTIPCFRSGKVAYVNYEIFVKILNKENVL